jgi:hypothetical protein
MTNQALQPKVEGPITGGAKGWPFGRPLFDLAEHGYVEEEFFLSGEATTYRQAPGTEWGREGRWQAEPKEAVAYRTRILVYRPADPTRFNHTAIVCWNNVTAGYELFSGESPEILEGGYAFVAATVQRVGVHGFPKNSQGLAAWDPERYGSLSIPTDDASFDIYTQVARAVGAGRDRSGVDPMAGLDVRKVIGLGASQSAGRLCTYINAIHSRERAYDGYMLQIYFGSGTPLEVGDAVLNINEQASPGNVGSRVRLRGTNMIREDLDVPVMVVNSELEATACYDVRQPDTDQFRYWESAGTCHVAVQSMAVRAPRYEREFGTRLPVKKTMNRIAITPLYDAGLHHLNGWIGGGEPPPTQPLIEFVGDPAEVVRDSHGIAVGGVRLPQADAPVAQNSAISLGTDIYSILYGSSHPFDAAKLDALYGDEATYLARFEEAARRSEKAGVLLPRDIAPAVDEAASEYRRAYAGDTTSS